MEQLLLTSRNLTRKKTQAKGSIQVFEKLKEIKDVENVFIEAELPDQEIELQWEEYFTPMYASTGFDKLNSQKLHNYKFQYLGQFVLDGQPIGFSEDAEHTEGFVAKLNDKKVFSSFTNESNACNCTWLIDMLLHAQDILEDDFRDEQLIWQQSAEGFELILEQASVYEEAQERQVFAFKNDFSTLSWQHYVLLTL